MFKKAVIHYPDDKKFQEEINKEIAIFHCAAAIKFMDTLGLDTAQKTAVIDSAIKLRRWQESNEKRAII
jgi:hypothetical protein